MIKNIDKDLSEKKRINPNIRLGTYYRLEAYAKINNIDASSSSVVLEKMINDYCDHLNIPDPFAITHED